MKIFIDFDDTLIDTTRLCKDAYGSFGFLSPEELQSHYKDFRKTNPFSIQAFTEYLNKKGIDGDRLRDIFFSKAADTSPYVFKDALTFLTNLKDAGHELILLTFDVDPEQWQHPKILSSGLKDLFDKIHVIQEKKSSFVKELDLRDSFVFIDDKDTETEAMQAAFPEALCLKHQVGAPLLSHLNKITTFNNNCS